MSEATFFRWKKQFEGENTKLKRLVADLMLVKTMR